MGAWIVSILSLVNNKIHKIKEDIINFKHDVLGDLSDLLKFVKIQYGELDDDVYDALPENIKQPIMKATNFETFTVSKKGKGNFRSIAKAIEKAPEGSYIIVKPGVYKENIVIKKQ